MFRGNYPIRIIQGATAAVGGCPKETLQHGLYVVSRVIQSANIFVGDENRWRGVSAGEVIRKLLGGIGQSVSVGGDGGVGLGGG